MYIFKNFSVPTKATNTIPNQIRNSQTSLFFWGQSPKRPTGAVHKVHHTSRTPLFSRPSTKTPRQKKPVYILSQLFAWVFVRGLSAGLVWKVLSGVVCPFPLLSGYICYNRKLKVISFRFKSVTSHALDLPPCHTFSYPPSSVTYFMDGPTYYWNQCSSSLLLAISILRVLELSVVFLP